MLVVQKKTSLSYLIQKRSSKKSDETFKKVGCVFLGKQPISSNETRVGQPLAFLVHSH